MSGAEPAACWVCQFAECEGNPDELLLSTGCACCREGSSGGRAHVSCVAAAAQHNEKLWAECPTCRQHFTGEMCLGLVRAHWDLVRGHPQADEERLVALSNVAAMLHMTGDDLWQRGRCLRSWSP